VLLTPRETLAGERFDVAAPDFGVALVEFGDVLVRLTTNFYVGHHSRQQGIEFHGDDGSLHLASWYRFDAPVEVAPFGGTYEPVPFVAEPYPGVELARGLNDLAEAVLHERPHRASAEQAAHVVEILCAIADSSSTGGGWVPIASTFPPSLPMYEAVAAPLP
jgi:predicted dehydrogenase